MRICSTLTLALLSLALACGSSVPSQYARQASCAGFGDQCSLTEPNSCCAGMTCGDLAGCCVRAANVCTSDDQCCSHHCSGGVCTCGITIGSSCLQNDDCCTGNGLECENGGDSVTGICVMAIGGTCAQGTDCGSGNCATTRCACSMGKPGARNCARPADCCAGFQCQYDTANKDPIGHCCGGPGASCSTSSECCSMMCDQSTLTCM